MKRSFTGRLAAVTAVLCLVTMSLTSGTLAKYASEKAGNAVATVAAWKIAFTDGADTPNNLADNFTLNLKDTAKETANLVATDKIAPGTTGSFKLAVDGTGTEVAFDYSIQMDMSGTGLDGAPIKFYSDVDCTTALVETSSGSKIYELKGSVLTNASNKVSAQTVYWKWDSTGIGTGTEDERDTALGEAATTFTIPVTITATQKTTV